MSLFYRRRFHFGREGMIRTRRDCVVVRTQRAKVDQGAPGERQPDNMHCDLPLIAWVHVHFMANALCSMARDPRNSPTVSE